jgi:hypothetical protein
MGFGTQWRRFAATVTLGLLAVALASAEVVACGTLFAPLSDGCCNSDGSCNTTPDNDPSGCCLKAQPNDLLVVEQRTPAGAVVECALEGGPADVPLVRPVFRRSHAPRQYSPPDFYLLNSAFLI